jgi:hypothetical protein
MRSLVNLALALGILSSGCVASTYDVAEPPTLVAVAEPCAEPAPPAPVQKVADDYFVQAGESYWPAELLARLPDGRAAMRFTANGSRDEGIVEPARMFLDAHDRSPAKDGEHLFVEWHGSYWPATVLEGPPRGSAATSTERAGERARIHYEGYGPEWDETVGPDRTKRLVPAT